ncbi:uncharacterized protein LOC144950124, partial [Lampetra fluviatilis]
FSSPRPTRRSRWRPPSPEIEGRLRRWSRGGGGGGGGDVEEVELPASAAATATSAVFRADGGAPAVEVVVGGHVEQASSQSNQTYGHHHQQQQQSQSHLQPQAHATPHGCNSRFRVVKLVEKEPFKKGRWNCTDFYEKDKELVVVGQASALAHHDACSVVSRESVAFSGPAPSLHAFDSQAYGQHHNHQQQQQQQQQHHQHPQQCDPLGGESVHRMGRDVPAASCGPSQPGLAPLAVAHPALPGFPQGYYEAAAPAPSQVAGGGNALPAGNGGGGFFEQQQQLGMPGAPPGIGWAPDNLQSVAASNVGSDALLQAGQQQQQQPLQVPQQGYGICLVEEGTDNPQLQQALGFHGGLLDQQIEQQQQQQMPSFGVQMQPPQLPPQAPLPNLSELQMRANSPHPPVLLQQQQQAWQQRMPPHPQTADGNFLQHSLASSAVHKPASPIAAGFPAVPKSPPSAVTQQLNSVLAQMHSSQGQQQFMAQNPHLRPLGTAPQAGPDPPQQLAPMFQQQSGQSVTGRPVNAHVLAQPTPVALGFDNIVSNVHSGEPAGVTSPLPVALAQTFNVGFADAAQVDVALFPPPPTPLLLPAGAAGAGRYFLGSAGVVPRLDGHQQQQQAGAAFAEPSAAGGGVDGAAVAVAMPSSGVAQGAVGTAEDDSSPGASMVAIDNKIEQAMDLVKSHLMFAVREEVEILREQIKELVDKNSHLEQENQALRGLANPEQLQELLSQLPDSTPPPAVAAGDGQNGGNGGGAAPPAAQQPPQGNAVPSA